MPTDTTSKAPASGTVQAQTTTRSQQNVPTPKRASSYDGGQSRPRAYTPPQGAPARAEKTSYQHRGGEPTGHGGQFHVKHGHEQSRRQGGQPPSNTGSSVGGPEDVWFERDAKGSSLVPLARPKNKILSNGQWGNGQSSSHQFKVFTDDDFNNHNEAEYHYMQSELFKQGEADLKESWDWKKQAETLQYDPDDPLLNPNDPLHAQVKDVGRQNRHDTFVSGNPDAKFEGDSWARDEREQNHFNMGYSMQQVPPFSYLQQRKGYRWAQPPMGNQTPLYHINWHEEVNDWSHRKKVARQYGPGYLHASGIPLVDVADMPGEELQQMRETRKQVREFRRKALRSFESNVVNLGKSNAPSQEQVDELVAGAKAGKLQYDAAVATLGINEGISEELASTMTAPGREMDHSPAWPSAYEPLKGLELWDITEARKMRGPGDPDLPEDVKRDTFEMFLHCIDKNNSLSPWQRKLAMLMIPKAFGGSQGEFLGDMVDEIEETRQRWQETFKPYLVETQAESSKAEATTATVGVDDLGL